MRGRKEDRIRQKESEVTSPGECRGWALWKGAQEARGMQ